MKWCYLGLLLFFGALPVAAEPLPLPKEDNSALLHVLNNFEIVAEKHTANTFFRVIKVLDHGECSPGRPESCPERTLYIPVSTIDLAPDEQLYKLPKAKRWNFLGWIHVPKHVGRDHFVTFEVKQQQPSHTPKTGGWIDTYYEIGVNPWRGYMKEIAAPTAQIP